jgi:hypothetical protein
MAFAENLFRRAESRPGIGRKRADPEGLWAASEDPFPDDPAWLDGEDGELPEPADARLALEYATAALVAGEVDLALHIYVYALVAAQCWSRA